MRQCYTHDARTKSWYVRTLATSLTYGTSMHYVPHLQAVKPSDGMSVLVAVSSLRAVCAATPHNRKLPANVDRRACVLLFLL